MQAPYVYAAPDATSVFSIYYSTQPDLKFALPDGMTGAANQTMRMIVKPDQWSNHLRFRFSNAFGTKPIKIARASVGLQASGASLVPGSNRLITFNGGTRVTVPVGSVIYSDAVDIGVDPNDSLLAGRNLAVSFYIQGTSGATSYHAAATTTSYLTAPQSGDHAAEEGNEAFPYSTTSWFLLDAVDAELDASTSVICCFGDSITDGTFSTLNGNDRWSNVLSERLHNLYGNAVSVVNAGIGGNAVQAVVAGPSAIDRLDRDVLSQSGLTDVLWLEGINDYGSANATAAAVIAGYQNVVGRLRARGIPVTGCTVTSSFGCTIIPSYASDATNKKRMKTNAYIRSSGLFDHVAEFDFATLNPATGELKPQFVPDSTKGTPGDKLHPNRAGYQAMGAAVDLSTLAPRTVAAGESLQ